MSKKTGLLSFTNSESALQHYQELGQNLANKQHEKLSTQLSVFQQALATFAKDHPEEIKSNEKFRNEFTKMCLSVGVDPLVASLSKKSTTKNSSGSLWSKLLENDNDEFYNELAVKILESCKSLQEINGGIIPIDELRKTLTNPDSPNSIPDLTDQDIEKSVELLSPLDPNLKIIKLGNQGKKFIRTIAKDLNISQVQVFEICEIMNYASINTLMANHGWSHYKAKDVLDGMVSSGFLWIDDQVNDGDIRYWDPSRMYNLNFD